MRRHKTRVESDVRLLDVPLRLIEKYRDASPGGQLFRVPRITNRKISQDMAILAESLSKVENDICKKL